jgi:ubiquitin-protein ligase
MLAEVSEYADIDATPGKAEPLLQFPVMSLTAAADMVAASEKDADDNAVLGGTEGGGTVEGEKPPPPPPTPLPVAPTAAPAAPTAATMAGGEAAVEPGVVPPPSVATADVSRETTRRLLHELRTLLRNPHPSFAVFPGGGGGGGVVNSSSNSSNITVSSNSNNSTTASTSSAMFWRVVIEGPDGTPYAGGCWLAYLKFPPDFPASPPLFKFETPIRHCNINQHGRICHSILDRNWTSDTSVLHKQLKTHIKEH